MRSRLLSNISRTTVAFLLSAGLFGCRDMTVDDVPVVDSGTDVAHAMDVAQDTGNPVDSGGIDVPIVTDTGPSDTGTADAGPCTAPGTLHPPHPDAGTANLFCPFSNPDGGASLYCNSGTQHCCEPTSGTAACQPTATACGTTDTDWQCEDPGVDCPTGSMCCGTGTLVINTDPRGCANYASGFHGTHCSTTCTAAEIRMCTSDGECATGQHCIPFKTKGNQVGGCM